MSKVFRKTQMTNKYTILLLHSTKHAGVQLKVNKIITPRKITWEFCIFEEGGPPPPSELVLHTFEEGGGGDPPYQDLVRN